jgi:hypothetical protein
VQYLSDRDRDFAARFLVDSIVAEGIFNELAAYVDTLGADTVLRSTKSRIAFVRRTRFLWVHSAPADGLWAAFLTNKPITSPRTRGAAVGKRFSTHVKLTGPLDAEVKRWIKRAYDDDVS